MPSFGRQPPGPFPQNLALALHPEYDYVLIRWKGEDEVYLSAEGRVSAPMRNPW
jgi:isoleucyl-tRNA synthetase